jgi:hypothetical protein
MCVILEPSAEEAICLRQRQLTLQARFGGQPHEQVHLTCQRFALQDESRVTGLIHQLAKLHTQPPFAIVAISLAQYEHQFWGTRVLRWHVRVTDKLHRFCTLVDDTLTQAGATLHYPFSTSWEPKSLTALENIPQIDLDSYLANTEYPHHLFYACQVVLSRIVGRGAFETLAQTRLDSTEETNEDHDPSRAARRQIAGRS